MMRLSSIRIARPRKQIRNLACPQEMAIGPPDAETGPRTLLDQIPILYFTGKDRVCLGNIIWQPNEEWPTLLNGSARHRLSTDMLNELLRGCHSSPEEKKEGLFGRVKELNDGTVCVGLQDLFWFEIPDPCLPTRNWEEYVRGRGKPQTQARFHIRRRRRGQ